MPKYPTKKILASAKERAAADAQIEQEIAAHLIQDGRDAAKLEEILTTLEQLDSAKMRKIFKESIPSIYYLITPKGGQDHNVSGLTCIYALHAALTCLVDEDYDAILQDMDDNHIATLKACIHRAADLDFHDFNMSASSIQSDIDNIQQKLDTGMETTSRVDPATGKVVPVSIKLTRERLEFLRRNLSALKVNLYFAKNDDNKENSLYQVASTEIYKLSSAIDKFQRIPKVMVPVAEQPKPQEKILIKTDAPKYTLWTLKQLADELNKSGSVATVTKIRNHRNNILIAKNKQDLKAKINTWFNKGDDGKIYFIADFFKEYKALFDTIDSSKSPRLRIKSAASNADKKATATKPAKTRAKRATGAKKPVEKPAANNEPMSLLNLRALETYLAQLTKLFETATKRAKKATEHADAAMQRALVEKDLQKRNDLIKEADKNNTIATRANDARDSIAKKINDANALLVERNAALVALQNADKKIADIVAKINSHQK